MGGVNAHKWFADTFGIHEYTTLDLDGGDLQLDLNEDLRELVGFVRHRGELWHR